MSTTPETGERPRLGDVMGMAFPMVVSQASETVNLFVDRIFLSKLGKLYLAGSLSGGISSFTLMSIFIGTVGYINAIVAQNDGAGKKRNCARATIQGLYLSLFSWPVLVLFIPFAGMFQGWLGNSPEQSRISMEYFRVLIYGSVFNISRFALGGFFIGLGKTRIVMLANIAGMLVNVPMNWILIFGKFGLPALGITGAAIGTVAGIFTINVILLAVYLSPVYRREYHTGSELGFHRPLAVTLLKFGSPAGIEFFLNLAAFNFFIHFMHSYGPDTAAAFTITINYDLVAFIPLLGLSSAVSALVGRYVGGKQIENAGKVTFMTLFLGWSYSSIVILLFVFGAEGLVTVFTRNLENGSVTVLPLARVMLRLAAIYILADSTQIIISGALRGAGDTRFVMWLSVILHWVFAAAIWYFIKIKEIPPIMAWVTFIVFVLVLGVFIVWRYTAGRWRKMSLVTEEA